MSGGGTPEERVYGGPTAGGVLKLVESVDNKDSCVAIKPDAKIQAIRYEVIWYD